MGQKKASEILESVQRAIAQKYDPDGDKIFSFAFMGGASGKILSPDIAVLTGKAGDHGNTEVLYVMHPQYLDNYRAPLAALQLTPMGKAGTMIDFYYPEAEMHPEAKELVAMIGDTLTNIGEGGWSHQVNWL